MNEFCQNTPVCYRSWLRSLILADSEVGKEEDDLLLPTIHPNSVLPFHPKDLNYEDYVYEEYEEALEHDQELGVTKPLVPQTTSKPWTGFKIASEDKPVFIGQVCH